MALTLTSPRDPQKEKGVWKREREGQADLSEQFKAARKHGVDSANAGEVEGGRQLCFAHSQPQQVARGHVALQNLLKQVVQRLWGTR